ncbi:MAG: GNAT family N-acetyltransferase [Christensenellaceae bacterium]
MKENKIRDERQLFAVSVRKVIKEDLPQIAEWRMSPEVTQYMYTDPVLTAEGQLRWFEKINSGKQFFYRMILAGQERVGLLYVDIDFENKCCNRQWYIGNQNYIGKGIGKVVQYNFNDYCFEQLGMKNQWCEVLANNTRAVLVNQKLGFDTTEILKDYVQKNGEWLDVVRMNISKEKWTELKPNLNYSKMEWTK